MAFAAAGPAAAAAGPGLREQLERYLAGAEARLRQTPPRAVEYGVQSSSGTGATLHLLSYGRQWLQMAL